MKHNKEYSCSLEIQTTIEEIPYVYVFMENLTHLWPSNFYTSALFSFQPTKRLLTFQKVFKHKIKTGNRTGKNSFSFTQT